MTRTANAIGCALLLVVVVIAIFAARDGTPQLDDSQGHVSSASAAPNEDSDSTARPPEASPGELRSEPKIEVRVVDAQRNPIPDCTAFVWVTGSRDSLMRVTGAGGLATFPSHPDDGGLAVFSPQGLHAYRRPVRLDVSHEIILDGSASIAGVVLVDGQPAPPGVGLALRSAWPPPPVDAPDLVREIEAGRAALLQTTTQSNGAFEFAGLPMDWRGTLLAPPTHWIVEAPGRSNAYSLDLVAPNPRITLGLTRLPTLHGRVVWKDIGSPVANAPIVAVGRCVDGVSASRSGTTDANGNFQLGLAPSRGGLEKSWLDPKTRPGIVDVQLTCAGVPGSEGVLSQRFSWAEAQASLTLELTRAALFHFKAETAGGLPVADAVVDSGECTPTDALGRGDYRGTAPKWVGAPGFSVTPARSRTGDGSASNPLRFVLSPGNAIRFRVRGIRPEHAGFFRVRVMSSIPVVAGGSKWRSPFHGRFGASSWDGGTSWTVATDGQERERITLDCALTSSLECVLDSLEPGIACTASLEDGLGNVLSESGLATPAFGTVVDLELGAHERPSEVAGFVTDSAGDGVPNAVVGLQMGKASTFCLTQSDGRFQLVSAVGTGALLRIEKSGYVKCEVPLDSERREPLRIQLVRGRTVTVRVVDEGRAPVDLYPVPVGFERIQQEVLRAGVAVWSDLPDSVDFELRLQGRTFRATCNLPEETLEFVVPRLGSLLVVHSGIARDNGLDEKNCRVELELVAAPQSAPTRVQFGPGDVTVKNLIPGEYRASLVIEQKGKDGSVRAVLPTGLTTTLRVEAGMVNRLRF